MSKCKRQVRCTICTPHKWKGNNRGRFKKQKRRAVGKEVQQENISVDELMEDLADCLEDIATCKSALFVGVTTYSGGSVVDRLRDNEAMLPRIIALLRLKGVNINTGETNGQ